METEDWFKLKKYPHIGEPLSIKDYNWVKKYVADKPNIAKHSFLPLIHKCISQRKFRPDFISLERTPKGKRRRIISRPKIRHIYYASHLDSLIFSYYNKLIYNLYETYISTRNYNEAVVAYRKIPLSKDSEKNKCNIDFAKYVFDHIKKHSEENLSVIVADVTSFFDNLDHKILKRQWAKILNKTSLPDDHFNVFKALTSLRYVEGDQLYNSYGNSMIVERGVPNSVDLKQHKRVKISSNRYFKQKNAIAYCTKKEFLSNNLNLVISANNKVGIPQGSPISATLANIYMIDFDQQMFDEVENIHGFYQRYSDDLIIVCEQKYEDDIINFMRDKIDNLVNLDIHPSKTKVYRFDKVNGVLTGYEIDEVSKAKNSTKHLEYLGFEFDGKRVLIKTSGFAKFYRSMKRSFRKSTSLALHSKNPDRRIFKSRLYKRFTYRGAQRKLIYRPSKENPKVYVQTKEFYWGNYMSYIYKANDSMSSINNSDIIKRQSRHFWKKFHSLLAYHQNRLDK